MQVTKKNLSDTSVRLTLAADAALLDSVKQQVLAAFAKDVKVQGFREGKAPLAMVEKHVDPARLQTEFIEQVMNRMYVDALEQENLRPVEQPKITVKKFVPFDTLEIEAEVAVVGAIKLPDYKRIKVPRTKVTVTAKEIDEVIADLRKREADKKEVARASKNGDEVIIDFVGVNAKTKEAIKGADGKDYPLALGSNTFIPGFEPELVGLKAGAEKTFTITFPKDYGAKALQNLQVTFTVTVKKVHEMVEPKLDDAFAAKAGPFKTVADLKADIKSELEARKEQQASQAYADEVLRKITEKTTIALPEVLVQEQIDRIEQDERQNLTYRGMTWQEFLDSEKLTNETYRKKIRPQAELRVKGGLVLSEVAEKEQLSITAQEVAKQLERLRAQYPDAKMQAEIDKPETRRSVASRLLTDKTINRLVEYAQK